MQQRRLLLALVLSSAILFLWTYFYPAPPLPQQNASTTPSPAASPAATQQAVSDPSTAQAAPLPTPNVSSAPQRTVTVRTPLYEAKFDTLGAEPVSWII
ncbi:MAG TPA: hypothetical protein VFP47_04180, partial [Pyrinomonadaceae bacterium]|nr:hypothetical protein [Pyrinomonadaceae bacterium]